MQEKQALASRGFPFKWQIAVIGTGLSLLFCGFTFILISLGSSHVLWKVLAGLCTSLGVILTVVGGVWFHLSVVRARIERGFYGMVKDSDAETWISDRSL